jgi:hypothetical protein
MLDLRLVESPRGQGGPVPKKDLVAVVERKWLMRRNGVFVWLEEGPVGRTLVDENPAAVGTA